LRRQAEAYVKEHIKWRAEITSGPRKEIPEIPVDAIREAIGNSLCHRDYANPKGNEVAIFKDRVDVYNPGTFPDELTPEDFIKGDGYSILRNPLIAETMYMSADIEKWASGLKRIYDECTAAGVKVEFKRVKTGFVVSFHRPKWEEGEGLGKSREKSREKVLRLIKENSAITTQEIAQVLNLSLKGVEKIIRTLKQQALLRRIGPDKGGHWEVSGETKE
jgi:ATP-dependent DNA helicase RecG